MLFKIIIAILQPHNQVVTSLTGPQSSISLTSALQLNATSCKRAPAVVRAPCCTKQYSCSIRNHYRDDATATIIHCTNFDRFDSAAYTCTSFTVYEYYYPGFWANASDWSKKV